MKKVQGRPLLAVTVVLATIAALMPIVQAAVVNGRVASNYRMSTDLKASRAKDAVGFALNPKDQKNIVSVNTDWTEQECEFHTSFDGGKTWKGGDLRAPEGFSATPCSSLGHGSTAMDASVDFGSGKNVYTTFASALEGQANSVLVSKSNDGGKTFEVANVALPGGAQQDTGPEYRFPKLVAEAGPQGKDTIYLVASARTTTNVIPDDDVIFTQSKDGGRTWAPPVRVDPQLERAIEPSQIVIGKNNALFVSWRTFGNDAFIKIGKSVDEGATWTTHTVVPVKGAPSTTGGFTASTFPRLAADRKTGNLYLVYGQGPVNGKYPGQTADHFIHRDMDVLFVRSTDGGETWSEPKLINNTDILNQPVTQTRHPNVSVAPNGRIDVVWQDRRHWYRACTDTHSACTEARLGDTYYASSSDGGQSFTQDRRITDRSMNNDVGLDYRFGTYWDFGPVAQPIGTNKILFGWMDSRLGNVDSDTQDIYLAKLSLNPRGPVPAKRVLPKGAVGMSVALSKLAYPGGSEAVLASTFATRPWSRVVIANKKDVPGMLAAGVLGRAHLGPVLLSGPTGLPAAVKREVNRLDSIGAFVIGNESMLGAGVVADLKAAGVPDDQITRLGGGSAAETAAAIATNMDKRTDQQRTDGVPAFDAAIIANPEAADASTASVLAANRRLPILFAEGGSIPQATQDALDALNIDKTLVIGGSRSVSGEAMATLPGAERLGGNKLYTTSRQVVEESVKRDLPTNIVYIADGKRPFEGALMGAAAGRAGGLLLLSPNTSVSRARSTLDTLGLLRGIDKLIMRKL